MTERPILFNGEMVRAILDGRKTQTRRIVKPQPGAQMEQVLINNRGEWPCPLGQVGDRLWVRETFQPFLDAYDIDCMPNVDYQTGKGYKISYPATDGIDEFQDIDSGDIKSTCKPSIHMPRWASRITLEITDVRIERLQSISEADAKAEGVEPAECCLAHYHGFSKLWQNVYGSESWEANPWVWVIEFRRVEK